MRSKLPKLTPALREKIIAAIHSGVYPHVAAETFGVPRDVLELWLAEGRKPKARGVCAFFAREIDAACAMARTAAETTVFNKDPHAWLAHGPGRDIQGNPGWSSPVRAADQAALGRNALLNPRLLALFHALLEVLTPFPEARAAAARTLLEQGLPI